MFICNILKQSHLLLKIQLLMCTFSTYKIMYIIVHTSIGLRTRRIRDRSHSNNETRKEEAGNKFYRMVYNTNSPTAYFIFIFIATDFRLTSYQYLNSAF